MTIKIVMTSYMPDEARLECAMEVATALGSFLHANESIALHIADDGSPNVFLPRLVDYARSIRLFNSISYTIVPRLGIGGSLNAALANVAADELWFYITDDWLLLDKLDLSNQATMIRTRKYDYVRVGPIHPNIHCVVRYGEGFEYWLEMQPEYGGYCFATRPFLASKQFYERVGPFLENHDAYDTERDYAERVRDSGVYMAYVGLLDTRSLWKHIGDVSPVGHIQPTTGQVRG